MNSPQAAILASNTPVKPVNLVYGVDDWLPFLITLVEELLHDEKAFIKLYGFFYA